MTATATPVRAALLARRAELCRALAQRDGIAIERFADPMDSVFQTIEREARARTMDSLAGQIAAVDAALGRIEAGGYGVCVDCERPIPALRLQAVPWAERCCPCASAFEREAGSER